MNEPTNSDILTTVRDVFTAVRDVSTTNRNILTAVEALDRELHLFRDVTEARFGLMGERFDRLEGRFDGVELTQTQHSSALTELATEVAGVHKTLVHHSRKLDRIERRVTAETRSLDDHELRIKALEPRR